MRGISLDSGDSEASGVIIIATIDMTAVLLSFVLLSRCPERVAIGTSCGKCRRSAGIKQSGTCLNTVKCTVVDIHTDLTPCVSHYATNSEDPDASRTADQYLTREH
jgi:hypothetical protein